MNKIKQLFDPQYVADLFRTEVLPHYPAYVSISRIVIRLYKDLIWQTTYHVVIGFDTYFLNVAGEEEMVQVVCSAHSNEPRENVYLALKYLWAQGFPKEGINLPNPLFYSDYFRGTFYQGISGEHLLYYISNKQFDQVEKIIVAAARLFARLHSLPASTAANFNPDNSRIKTVTPGVEKILREISRRYDNKYNANLVRWYDYFIEKEEKFFSESEDLLSLIHGDAHPENIIKTSENSIGLIDFTDICLGDYTRDIGTFLQQMDYKLITKVGVHNYGQKLNDMFLAAYWKASNKRWTPEVQERIDLYYNWTAIRTATYWFMKYDHDEFKAVQLLDSINKRFKA